MACANSTSEHTDCFTGLQAQLAMGTMGLPVLLSVLQEDRDDLELLKGALEVLQLSVALPDNAHQQQQQQRQQQGEVRIGKCYIQLLAYSDAAGYVSGSSCTSSAILGVGG